MLAEVLNVCNALFKEIVQKKEETIGMSTMLEPEVLIMNLNKEKAAHLDSEPPGLTITEVLEAYYDFDETIKELFNDIKFNPNEKQENKLEVLLKKVATECNALIKKLASGKKKPSRNPEINKNKKDNKKNSR
ncbi:hypothetical protein F8M41_010015 [Gigaspora margarita]|uniref:Uncharacterized protein n=1 Tax=Gigaspora margarita TaxID=4874 RepID=A0A8H4EQE5_GIGMA|nr:hypothetical protein F8M41_010015 [Gigaspora margarita]